MSRVLVDTNVLINLFQKNITHPKLQEVLESDKDIVITNLIYIEFLRGINYNHKRHYLQMREFLNNLEILQVNRDIYNMAIDLNRFCKSKGVTLKGKCEVIDFINFCSAKHYNLKTITNDRDFDILEEYFNKLKESND